MGHKPSSNLVSDRPESGGADHDSQHENSGLLNRDRQTFANARKAMEPQSPHRAGALPEEDDEAHATAALRRAHEMREGHVAQESRTAHDSGAASRSSSTRSAAGGKKHRN